MNVFVSKLWGTAWKSMHLQGGIIGLQLNKSSLGAAVTRMDAPPG